MRILRTPKTSNPKSAILLLPNALTRQATAVPPPHLSFTVPPLDSPPLDSHLVPLYVSDSRLVLPTCSLIHCQSVNDSWQNRTLPIHSVESPQTSCNLVLNQTKAIRQWE